MNLLIVAATSFEIKPALRWLKSRGISTLITGAGMPAAFYQLGRQIVRNPPDLLIQAGISGSFDRRIPLGAVRAVSSDFFGDIGVREAGSWRTLADLKLENPNRSPYKAGRLVNPHWKLLLASDTTAVPAVTVNTISTNKAMIGLFKKQEIKLESMEGAVLHYLGLMEKVPFLQLRAVSNYVGERDKSRWRIAEAIAELGTTLIRTIENIQSLT